MTIHHSSRHGISANGFPCFPVLCLALGLAIMPFLCGCERTSQPQTQIDMKSEYQAVFLSNGQTFIGKLTGAGSDYPLLSNVFYIQSQADKETGQVTNILVKRGKEWHSPEFMYINARHILAIEPVKSDSQVAKLIREANGTKEGGAP